MSENVEKLNTALPSCISILLVCTLFNHTGAQYSAVEYTSANEAVRNVSALAPQFVPVSFRTNLTRAATIFVVLDK
jgi:hypothetical protein